MFSSSEKNILLVVVIMYFLFLLGQGLYFAKKTKTAEEYVVAGRSMPLFPLILSIFGTAVGGATLLGFSAEGYNSGLSRIWGMAPAWIVMLVMNFILIKPIRNVGEKYHMKTIPDFVALRFGENTRIPAVISILFAYCAITGLQFIAIAGLLNIILGINIKIGIIIGWFILTAKTHYGGLTSVIWSDSVQGSIQALGVFGLVVLILAVAGGWGSVVDKAVAAGKPEFVNAFSMSAKDLFIFVFTIGAYQVMRQDQWQRIWAGKTGKVAYLSQWISWVLAVASGISIVVIGTVAKMGLGIKVANAQLLYYSVVKELVPFGVGVLLIVALMATVVSCADSFLVCGASSLSNDIVRIRLKVEDEEKMLKYSRYSVWVVSVVALLLALYIPYLIKLWTTGTAMLTAGLLIPVLAGFFWKRASNAGGLASCWGGLSIAVIWQLLNSPLGIHPVFIGLAVSLALMVVVQGVGILERLKATGFWTRQPSRHLVIN